MQNQLGFSNEFLKHTQKYIEDPKRISKKRYNVRIEYNDEDQKRFHFDLYVGIYKSGSLTESRFCVMLALARNITCHSEEKTKTYVMRDDGSIAANKINFLVTLFAEIDGTRIYDALTPGYLMEAYLVDSLPIDINKLLEFDPKHISAIEVDDNLNIFDNDFNEEKALVNIFDKLDKLQKEQT